MSGYHEMTVRAVCLRAGLCTAEEIEQALAVRYQLSMRGEDADLLDILIRQGSLSEDHAQLVRDGAIAAGMGFQGGGAPQSPTQTVAPAGGARSDASQSAPQSGAAPRVDATMDFRPEDLQAALLCSKGGDFNPSATVAIAHDTQMPPCRDDAEPVDPSAEPAAEEDGVPFGSDLVGRVLGGCRMERELGRGAMGVVFEATHLSLQRRVAVKLLMPSARRDKLDVDQFFQEARAMARIEHQNIVQVHDVGEEDGLHFIVMQLLDGCSVADRLERERMFTWEEAARIARDAAKGLAVAHEKGIIHRDIKPENLMLTSENVVKIADFGLAAKAARGTEGSGRTEVMGTPAYMSPEQIDGRHVDGRADVYSLGCTLYVMLTGRKPFEGETAIEVLLKQTKDIATPVLKLVPTIPPLVSQVVEKCMAKFAGARYQNAADLAADLDKILSGGKPKVVVEIEDVMQRMQEVVRGDAMPARGPASRPVVVVSAAVALVCTTVIVMMLALPDVELAAAEQSLVVAQPSKSVASLEARAALAEAEEFGKKNLERFDLVEQRYDEVLHRHGTWLATEFQASHDRVAAAYDALRAERFAAASKQAEEALRAKDWVGAVEALLAFPPELRRQRQAEEWTARLGEALDAVRTHVGMAYVPGGAAKLGSDAAATREISAFLIDLTEVSNAEYAEFVAATNGRAPAHWEGVAPPESTRDLPVVGVTAKEAEAYAAWKGKRLPSAAEWERAARGEEAWTFPWGQEFDPARCVSRSSARRELAPVRSFPGGRSLCGAYNMAGNAAEWTADLSSDPLKGIGRVVRGGSARSDKTACTAFASYYLPDDASDPWLVVGFRCAQDVVR